jgi:ParB family chromosome partitioning protein
MATTAPRNEHGPAANDRLPHGGVQLRHIPLSKIVVPDSFNPRGEVADDRELEQLAESIRTDGCLQPIRVRATDHGDYVLIAGERRYRAAVKAAVMELPAIIRPAGAGDEEESSGLLIEALIENDLRRDLDPVARARGYQRLVDSGLTVKGVAERLQTTQARVREHLRILKLPDELQEKIAGDAIPLRAVKALAKLESVDAGLAVAAAREVLEPDESYEAYSWADLERAPLEVALSGGALPEGIYRAHSPYRLSAFTLADGAIRDVAAIDRILGRPLGEMRFDATDLEQARALGAAHGDGWQSIIVGTDIADQLVGDHLSRMLKELRRRERTARDAGATRSRDSGGAVREGDGSEDDGSTAREAEAARQADRESERQAREQATRFNLELGRALYTTLSRMRVDDAVLKILASTEIVGELADVAMRGARYGLPGWVTETTQRNGKVKYTYLEKHEAGQRASEYLARAVKPGEIVGRQLVLLAMATYADQNAVAVSNRTWHEVKASGPWTGEVDELLDKLMRDNLPDGAVALLMPLLERRERQRGERAAARRAREEAAARLDGIEERIGDLTSKDVDQAEKDLEAAWTGWTPRHSTLRQLLADRRQQLAGSDSE